MFPTTRLGIVDSHLGNIESGLIGENASVQNNGTAYLSTTSIGPLSGVTSPFTIAFWLKLNTLAQSSTYLIQSYRRNSPNDQWAIIYGYTTNTVEFFSVDFSGTDPRTSSGITLSDTNWHHIAYRYNGTIWDKFLDGTKTNISSSRSFTLPGSLAEFYVFAAGVFGGSPTAFDTSSIASLMIDNTAWSDANIALLASGSYAPSIHVPAFFWPLKALISSEPEYSNSSYNLTLNGTLVTGSIPPIIYPSAIPSAIIRRTTFSGFSRTSLFNGGM